MKQMYFPLFFQVSTTKNYGNDMYRKHNKTLKDRERKSDWFQGLWHPRNNLMVSSLRFGGFVFPLPPLINQLELKKLTTQKYQQAQTKSSNRACSLQLEDQERGCLARPKLLDCNHSYSSPTPQKKLYLPSVMPAKAKWKIQFLPLPGCNEVLHPPSCMKSEAKQGAKTFIPTGNISADHMGEPRLLSDPQ